MMLYGEEEREKLIKDKEHWRDLYREQLEKNKKLKNRVKQLEERLDNKEKVNKQLREEIQQRINAVNNK